MVAIRSIPESNHNFGHLLCLLRAYFAVLQLTSLKLYSHSSWHESSTVVSCGTMRPALLFWTSVASGDATKSFSTHPVISLCNNWQLILPVIAAPETLHQAVSGMLCGQVTLSASNAEPVLVLADAIGFKSIHCASLDSRICVIWCCTFPAWYVMAYWFAAANTDRGYMHCSLSLWKLLVCSTLPAKHSAWKVK